MNKINELPKKLEPYLNLRTDLTDEEKELKQDCEDNLLDVKILGVLECKDGVEDPEGDIEGTFLGDDGDIYYRIWEHHETVDGEDVSFCDWYSKSAGFVLDEFRREEDFDEDLSNQGQKSLPEELAKALRKDSLERGCNFHLLRVLENFIDSSDHDLRKAVIKEFKGNKIGVFKNLSYNEILARLDKRFKDYMVKQGVEYISKISDLLEYDMNKVENTYYESLKESLDNYPFETLFWWIYGDEDPLNLKVVFEDTVNLINDKYASIVWEDAGADGKPENLDSSARQDILDHAKKEAESWTNYDIYHMPARYTNTLTLYKGLKKLLGAECDRLDEELKESDEEVSEVEVKKEKPEPRVVSDGLGQRRADKLALMLNEANPDGVNGPFAEDPATSDDATVKIESQAGYENTTFNDDGSVDVEYHWSDGLWNDETEEYEDLDGEESFEDLESWISHAEENTFFINIDLGELENVK